MSKDDFINLAYKNKRCSSSINDENPNGNTDRMSYNLDKNMQNSYSLMKYLRSPNNENKSKPSTIEQFFLKNLSISKNATINTTVTATTNIYCAKTTTRSTYDNVIKPARFSASVIQAPGSTSG